MNRIFVVFVLIFFCVRVPLQPFSIISCLRSALDKLCFAFTHVQQPLVLNLLCAHSSQFIIVHDKVLAERKPTEDVTRAAKTYPPLYVHGFVCVFFVFLLICLSGRAGKEIFSWQYF